MSQILEAAVADTKRSIKIIYLKESESEPLPAGGVNLNEMIDINGKKFTLFQDFSCSLVL